MNFSLGVHPKLIVVVSVYDVSHTVEVKVATS